MCLPCPFLSCQPSHHFSSRLCPPSPDTGVLASWLFPASQATHPPWIPVPSTGMTSPKAGKQCSPPVYPGAGTSRSRGTQGCQPSESSVGGGHSCGLTLTRSDWHGTPCFWRQLRGTRRPAVHRGAESLPRCVSSGSLGSSVLNSEPFVGPPWATVGIRPSLPAGHP